MTIEEERERRLQFFNAEYLRHNPPKIKETEMTDTTYTITVPDNGLASIVCDNPPPLPDDVTFTSESEVTLHRYVQAQDALDMAFGDRLDEVREAQRERGQRGAMCHCRQGSTAPVQPDDNQANHVLDALVSIVLNKAADDVDRVLSLIHI